MGELFAGQTSVTPDENEISFLALASIMLRWRRMIVGLGVAGSALGMAIGLSTPRVYTTAATFLPQGSESAGSGLALEASKFGIRLPSMGGGTWGPPLYVELLGSAILLEPIALDSVLVTEQGVGRQVALMDLLGVRAPTPAGRIDVAVSVLRRIVKANEDKKLSAVKLTVTTEWPSVSLTLAERLLRGVNRFNLEMRKSQAVAERLFVETQGREAERALREAEDRLQLFLQRNRAMANSPELAFQRDRLQRDMTLRQQVYTSLLQNLEEARIREVRDTPVITVIETPRLPTLGESRRSVQKAVLGGLLGGMLGVLIAFLLQTIAGVRRMPNEEARYFLHLVEEAIPPFFRRR